MISIYLSTYIAPLKGNYSEALPAQAGPKRRILSHVFLGSINRTELKTQRMSLDRSDRSFVVHRYDS